jgi:hypothetical protein
MYLRVGTKASVDARVATTDGAANQAADPPLKDWHNAALVATDSTNVIKSVELEIGALPLMLFYLFRWTETRTLCVFWI